MEKKPAQQNEFNDITKKILIIFGIIGFLIIPLSCIESQISYRKEYERMAQYEVAKGWGEDVKFGTAVISDSDRIIYANNSETKIEVDSQEKKRGVFKVPVYTINFKTKVLFNKPTITTTKINAKKSSNEKYLVLPVKPISSIQSIRVRELISGKDLKVHIFDRGIRLSAEELPSKDFFSYQIEFEVSIRGTGVITYETNSDQDQVEMKGNWIKPKFSDTVLPTKTTLSDKGFEASWSLNSLPNWEETLREVKSIGLSHLWIQSDYAMIERAVKYGILFIVLTFLLIFILEFVSKIKIHPFQYGLIGLSISFFYLLLLATSEILGFNLSYLSSSLVVVSLIIFYVRGFLNHKKLLRMILFEQVSLSIFFYVLLTLEERALLIGSIGLFAVLALLMIITRRFDWYTGAFNKTYLESKSLNE